MRYRQLCKTFDWIACSRDAGFAVGCSVCARMRCTLSPWGLFQVRTLGQLTWRKAAKHCNSRSHKLALAGTADVPSALEWQQCLDNFHLGLSARSGTKEHAKRWCLDQGLRLVQQRILREVATVALSQDVRNNRLLMGLTACTTSFERISFTIGQTQCMGTSSYALAKTTLKLINSFCTRFGNMPPYGAMRPALGQKDLPEGPDRDLVTLLLQKTEALVTDAASDEMKAGRLLSGREPTSVVPQTMPNVKFHCHLLCVI